MKAAALVGLGLLLSPVLARAQQASGSRPRNAPISGPYSTHVSLTGPKRWE